MVVGVMSGTSLDGVDAALVEFSGDVDALGWELRGMASCPYDADQRQRIHDAITDGSAHTLCVLNAELGEWFAEAVLRVCREAGIPPGDVRVIGSHGQTVWHEPPRAGGRGATLQLGCAATIAERTGIAVVHDFRARDMAAGGQGAPLVPWVDRTLFSHPTRRRVLQNIGGMANLTWLPPRNSGGSLLAFDTGPGNALMDAAVELATGGERTFDLDGDLARAGNVDEAMLRRLLDHPFLAASPPKSTGREAFGRPLVQALAAEVDGDWPRLVCTLAEFTARTIADAVSRWVLPRGVDEIILTGGGALNPFLVMRIRALLQPIPVLAGDSVLGVAPTAKEAVAFATLAWAHVRAIPANAVEATGAAGPRILGSYTPA